MLELGNHWRGRGSGSERVPKGWGSRSSGAERLGKHPSLHSRTRPEGDRTPIIAVIEDDCAIGGDEKELPDSSDEAKLPEGNPS